MWFLKYQIPSSKTYVIFKIIKFHHLPKVYRPIPFIWSLELEHHQIIEKKDKKGPKRNNKKEKKNKSLFLLSPIFFYEANILKLKASKPIPLSFLNSNFLSHTDTHFNLCFLFSHTHLSTLPFLLSRKTHFPFFPIFFSFLFFYFGIEKFHLYLLENQEKLWIRHFCCISGLIWFSILGFPFPV